MKYFLIPCCLVNLSSCVSFEYVTHEEEYGDNPEVHENHVLHHVEHSTELEHDTLELSIHHQIHSPPH